ncbi:hypothetical protein [Streptomyces decoyicus]
MCLAAPSASPARGGTPVAAPEVLADHPLLHGILLPPLPATAVRPADDPWPDLEVPARSLTVQTAALAVAKAATAARPLDGIEAAVVDACARMTSLPDQLAPAGPDMGEHPVAGRPFRRRRGEQCRTTGIELTEPAAARNDRVLANGRAPNNDRGPERNAPALGFRCGRYWD